LQFNNNQLVDNLNILLKAHQDSSGRVVIDDKFNQALIKTVNSNQPSEILAETKNISILLSDLRGFTAMSEKYSAQIVIKLLNRYFTKMSEIIDRHGGMVDKFMGDSIMVLFGAFDSAAHPH